MKSVRLGTTIIGILAAANVASAQSASVTLNGAATAQPGDMIAVTLTSDYDTAGAGAGIFGTAGFFGFGGNVIASGSAASMVTASAPQLNAMLDLGPVALVNDGANLVRAAAGRQSDGLAANPAEALSFTVTIDAGVTAPSDVTLDFEGAVVLSIGSDLETFSTDPGLNQNALSTNALTITIEAADCICEFDGDPAQVNVLDLLAFLGPWFAGDPAANVDGVGGVDVLDLLEFLGCWFPASVGGC